MVDEDMAKVGMGDVGMPRVGMEEVVILTINSGNSNSLPKKTMQGKCMDTCTSDSFMDQKLDMKILYIVSSLMEWGNQ